MNSNILDKLVFIIQDKKICKAIYFPLLLLEDFIMTWVQNLLYQLRLFLKSGGEITKVEKGETVAVTEVAHDEDDDENTQERQQWSNPIGACIFWLSISLILWRLNSMT